MRAPRADSAFFIGWSNSVAPRLLRFALCLAAGVVALLVGAGILLGSQVDDPAGDLFALAPGSDPSALPGEWQGDQTLRGVVIATPYPVLHVAADAAYPIGRTLLLSGDGKRGPDIAPGNGVVELRGAVLRRGSIEMLIVEAPATPIVAEQAGEVRRQSLGRWRAAGEICDGKCYAGAMKPGAGLAHRACANLCLFGDLPPVFVLAAPLAGSRFLLLTGEDGGRPGEQLRDLVAVPVELEGEVERIGALLVFRTRLDRARRL